MSLCHSGEVGRVHSPPSRPDIGRRLIEQRDDIGREQGRDRAVLRISLRWSHWALGITCTRGVNLPKPSTPGQPSRERKTRQNSDAFLAENFSRHPTPLNAALSQLSGRATEHRCARPDAECAGQQSFRPPTHPMFFVVRGLFAAARFAPAISFAQSEHAVARSGIAVISGAPVSTTVAVASRHLHCSAEVAELLVGELSRVP